MSRLIYSGMLLAAFAVQAEAEEVFVTIQKVSGNQLMIVKSGGGGGAGMAGRGPRGGANSSPTTVVTVPANVKVTSAMRERRTNEFRVGAELAGGLRNKVFQNIDGGLQARFLTDGAKVTEINVITSTTDINQSNTSAEDGQAVIAIRPKRPPMKKK